MNSDVRRKLEMAVRVRIFSKAKPDTGAGYTTVLTRLEELIVRAEALATQQRAGQLAVRAATSRRRELRRDLHMHLLRHVTRVAEVAAKEQPELGKKFQLPPLNGTYQGFRTAARAMVEEAQAQKELLLGHGMSETVLADLEKALGEYDQVSDQTRAGRQAHVGARADLEAVMADIMQQVELLDGLNRYRFRTDAEQLAAWESARNIPWPNREPAQPTAGDGTGSVAPAA